MSSLDINIKIDVTQISIILLVSPFILTSNYTLLYYIPLIVGLVLPTIDAISPQFHRSWLAHTFFLPAVLYQVSIQTGLIDLLPFIDATINFAALGMTAHFLSDYVYPKNKTNEGAQWPVRPVFFSDPWGLMWLGIAWSIQWFIYLSIEFFPWLFRLLNVM